MSHYSNRDSYCDPVAGVPKNRFGIADPAILEETEAALVAIRSQELARNPVNGHFDLAHLQAIHRHLFGDVYDRAGQLRMVGIAKSNNMFSHHNG